MTRIAQRILLLRLTLIHRHPLPKNFTQNLALFAPSIARRRKARSDQRSIAGGMYARRPERQVGIRQHRSARFKAWLPPGFWLAALARSRSRTAPDLPATDCSRCVKRAKKVTVSP